jgi:hypothetical protein
MGMGLMVVFGKNTTGNWGGALIDVEKGSKLLFLSQTFRFSELAKSGISLGE